MWKRERESDDASTVNGQVAGVCTVWPADCRPSSTDCTLILPCLISPAGPRQKLRRTSTLPQPFSL